MIKRTLNYICHLLLPQNVNRNAEKKDIDLIRFITLLNDIMATEYKKVYDADYGDCGYPLFHYERDLYLTYDKILHDEDFFIHSQMSKEDYVSAVNDYYYNNVVKDFEESYSD